MKQLNQYEIGYLAGFIDGEGALLINKRLHKNKYSPSGYIGYSAYIDIGNTNYEVLAWIKGLLEITSSIYENQCLGNRKMAYRLRISYRQSKPLIQVLMPYLIVKKKQAILFLQYEEVKEKESLFQQMKVLNKRGIAV